MWRNAREWLEWRNRLMEMSRTAGSRFSSNLAVAPASLSNLKRFRTCRSASDSRQWHQNTFRIRPTANCVSCALDRSFICTQLCASVCVWVLIFVRDSLYRPRQVRGSSACLRIVCRHWATWNIAHTVRGWGADRILLRAWSVAILEAFSVCGWTIIRPLRVLAVQVSSSPNILCSISCRTTVDVNK